MDTNSTLTEQQRQQLDGIVHQMTVNKEPDHAIQFVVSDFKQKYGQPNTEPATQNQPGFFSKIGSIAKSIGGAVISSEKSFGQDIAGAVGGNLFAGDIEKANSQIAQSDLDYIKAIKNGRDKAVAAGADTSRYDNLLKNFHTSTGANIADLFPALTKSNGQVIGDAAGVLLDTLSAGSYGNVAKGAKSFELLTKADKVANAAKAAEEAAKVASVAKNIETAGKVAKTVIPVTEQVVKDGLGSTLKTIGKKTLARSAVGAGTGYAYDVSQNLQNGESGGDVLKPGAGTLIGATVPIAIGGIQAAGAITKDTAPRIVNSLVKPKAADFAYGKNPGRTVSTMGITGNNLEDFANNIHTAKNDVGTLIGDIYSNPANANVRINAQDEIAKIDNAINDAAKGGKNNQGIVTTLQNIKDSLLHTHAIDGEGNIIKTSTEPKNLTNLTAEEAFNLKNEIANRTQFTGRPSDDKTINSILKDIYGGLKEKLNKGLSVNNPEITDLNQKYADLTSAEIATRNRDKIVQRSNLVSLPQSIGGVGATISALALGTAALPATLAGLGTIGLEKALGTTAVKTRIAAWLGKESPGIIQKVLQKNPDIGPILLRAFPNFASKINLK